jgi:hypothetical protein
VLSPAQTFSCLVMFSIAAASPHQVVYLLNAPFCCVCRSLSRSHTLALNLSCCSALKVTDVAGSPPPSGKETLEPTRANHARLRSLQRTQVRFFSTLPLCVIDL